MTAPILQRAIDAGAKALNDRDGQKYSYSFWRHTAEIVIEASGMLDLAEAARDAISECDLAPDSPLPDGRSWCCAHQDWDFAGGPHCAMAELRTSLGKISAPAGEIPREAQ